jgi:hypothetical protein
MERPATEEARGGVLDKKRSTYWNCRKHELKHVEIVRCLMPRGKHWKMPAILGGIFLKIQGMLRVKVKLQTVRANVPLLKPDMCKH